MAKKTMAKAYCGTKLPMSGPAVTKGPNDGTGKAGRGDASQWNGTPGRVGPKESGGKRRMKSSGMGDSPSPTSKTMGRKMRRGM